MKRALTLLNPTPRSLPRLLLACLLLLNPRAPLAAQSHAYTPPPSRRVDYCLDRGWRFIRQDVPGAQAVHFDDAAWSSIQLPHTWNNLDGEDGKNDYYRGIGWYRTHYQLDKSLTGRRFFLKFDGAFLVTEVFVNGAAVGQHQGGFAAFVFDVTPCLQAGKDNVIAVKVSNAPNPDIPPLSADFTFFGGLYRGVHLLATDPVHISPLDYGSPGVYLKTTNVSANAADLQVTTVVSNASARARTVQVRAVVADAHTNVVTTITSTVTLPPASVSNVVGRATLRQPHLWNGLYDPYLYHAFVEVRDGDTQVVDLVAQPLGFRSFRVDPNQGFFLNGQPYDLHGVSLHQDWLHRGWAIGSAERRTNFALLKQIGATALRLSHYEHAEDTYELADQHGIALWTEIPLVNNITESPAFYTNALLQMRELIRQQYNHPAVVCWGIFNEITMKPGPRPANLARQLAELVAQEDPTRPSTSAANAADDEPSNWCSELSSFNKYFGWYNGGLSGFGAWADRVHAHYPTRCIGVSEYGAGANPAHHSESPAQPDPGGPFHPEEYQNLLHESHWQQMQARPFLWCKLLWNLCDFASDGRSEGGAPGRNDKGLITYDRQLRKDAFYYYQANWTTNPMVYITGHRFTHRLTNAVTAKVYANCDSVELFLNQTSLGTRSSTNCIFTWPLMLRRGTNILEAVGTKGASQVSDSLVWIAPPMPPAVSLLSPAAKVVHLNRTNDTLSLSATAEDPQPDPVAPLTVTWTQCSGPGTVVFSAPHARATTARFNAPGIYGLRFGASNGASASADLVVVVEPTLALRDGLAGWWRMTQVDGLAIVDASGQGRDATLSGTPPLSTTHTNGLLFDGLGSHATFACPEANRFTVTAWVRADASGQSQFPHVLDTPAFRLFARFGEPSKNSLGFATYASGRNGDWFSGVGTLHAGAWHHIAVSYDRSSPTNLPSFYVNGARLAPYTISLPAGTEPGCAGTAYIGNNARGNRAWKGAIHDLRLYQRLLTEAEIQVLAAAPWPTGTQPALMSRNREGDPALSLPR